MKKTLIFLTLLVTLFISSCTSRLIDFTTISSKNVVMRVPNESKGVRVSGEDYVFVFLGVPLGVPNLKAATDRAIESAGKDYDCLIDGVVYTKRKWYVLFGKMGYEVQGTPIKTAGINNK
jgi:hypothetical protein